MKDVEEEVKRIKDSLALSNDNEAEDEETTMTQKRLFDAATDTVLGKRKKYSHDMHMRLKRMKGQSTFYSEVHQSIDRAGVFENLDMEDGLNTTQEGY